MPCLNAKQCGSTICPGDQGAYCHDGECHCHLDHECHNVSDCTCAESEVPSCDQQHCHCNNGN